MPPARRVMARSGPGPAEDTKSRQERLVRERDDAALAENRVTTVASMYGPPDGSDDRVYSADGTLTVLDDELTEPQREVFGEMLDEIDNDEIIDLGQGSFPGAVGQPAPSARLRESRPQAQGVASDHTKSHWAPENLEIAEPQSRQVIERQPVDATKIMVDVVAKDDLITSIGYNGGKAFEFKRGKTHRIPLYAARHLADKGLIDPPRSRRPW